MLPVLRAVETSARMGRGALAVRCVRSAENEDQDHWMQSRQV